MKKSLRIIIICLFLSLSAFLGIAAGQQETENENNPPQNDRPPQYKKIELPASSELTLIRLQYFIENAENEPELALTTEQAQIILPILEDWSAAAEEDETINGESFAADINDVLTAEQRSYMPPAPAYDRPDGDDRGQRLTQGDRPPQGERPPQGKRPEAPVKPTITEILAGLTFELSKMI